MEQPVPDRASPAASPERRSPQLARLLAATSDDLREALGRAASERRFRRGEVILPAGAVGRELGFVLDGALGMLATLEDGREHVLGILGPSDLYGRPFDDPPLHRIEALSDGLRLAFDRPRLEAALERDPSLTRIFLASALDELDAAREWILLLNGAQAAQRVASFLVILARRRRVAREGRAAAPLKVRLPARRVDLARCLGLRPETFSRAIHRLADEGVIRIINSETFEIRDLDALAEASGQDLPLDRPGAAHDHPGA